MANEKEEKEKPVIQVFWNEQKQESVIELSKREDFERLCASEAKEELLKQLKAVKKLIKAYAFIDKTLNPQL